MAPTLAGSFTATESQFNYKIVLDYSCYPPPHSLNNSFKGWLVNIGFSPACGPLVWEGGRVQA